MGVGVVRVPENPDLPEGDRPSEDDLILIVTFESIGKGVPVDDVECTCLLASKIVHFSSYL